MLYNVSCCVCYISPVMLYNIKCCMLYNIDHVMLYNMCHVMLYNICHVISFNAIVKIPFYLLWVRNIKLHLFIKQILNFLVEETLFI